MSLNIDLTPAEEAQLSTAAREMGLTPTELAKKLVKDNLPSFVSSHEVDLDAKLRKWQQETSTQLMPDVLTETLFARWAEEDAFMSDEEREAENRLWEELEKSLTENGRTLELRRLA